MIEVLTMEYWDGSKFMARLDKPSADNVIPKIRKVMQERLLNLPPMEQRRLALDWARGKGQMVLRKKVLMEEEDYNKVEKLKE